LRLDRFIGDSGDTITTHHYRIIEENTCSENLKIGCKL
jgi:hypothetical protein